MNMSKLTSCSELLNHVDLKTMGPISIKEMFIFRNYQHDLRGFNKLHQPTYNSRFIHRSY